MWRLTGVWPDLNVNSMMDFDPALFNIMSRYPELLRRVGEPIRQSQHQPAEQESEPHVEDEQPSEPLSDAEVFAIPIQQAQPVTNRDDDLSPATVVIHSDATFASGITGYTYSMAN